MLGSNIGSVGWPNCGEIDVMENIGREPSINHGSMHGPAYSGGNSNHRQLQQRRCARRYLPRLPAGLGTELGAVLGRRHVYETRTPSDTRGNPWVFNHPFFMLLNVAVGGGWPGSPDGSTQFPQQMKIGLRPRLQLDVVRGIDRPGPGGLAGREPRFHLLIERSPRATPGPVALTPAICKEMEMPRSKLRYTLLGVAAVATTVLALAVAVLGGQRPSRRADQQLVCSAPYLMPESNNPPNPTTVMTATGQKAFQLAFILAPNGGGCTPTWDGTSPISSDTVAGNLINSNPRRRRRRVRVGGRLRRYQLGQTCGSVAATAAAYQQVVDKYGLKAIDFDLRGARVRERCGGRQRARRRADAAAK